MKDIAKWFLKCSQWFIIISFQSDVKTQWKLWAGIGFNHFKVIFSRASTVTVFKHTSHTTDQRKLLDWKYKKQSARLSEPGPQRPSWSEIPFFSFQCWIICFSQKGIKKKEAFSSKANMKLHLQSQRSYSRRLFRGKQACFYLNPWASKSQLWLDFRRVTMCEHVLEKAILFNHPVTISHYLRITSWVLYNKASTEDSNHSLSNAAWGTIACTYKHSNFLQTINSHCRTIWLHYLRWK